LSIKYFVSLVPKCEYFYEHFFAIQLSLSRIIAEAPPPPLQILAIPRVASLVRRTFKRLVIIRVPEAPMGCPKATAPP